MGRRELKPEPEGTSVGITGGSDSTGTDGASDEEGGSAAVGSIDADSDASSRGTGRRKGIYGDAAPRRVHLVSTIFNITKRVNDVLWPARRATATAAVLSMCMIVTKGEKNARVNKGIGEYKL